MLTAESGPWGLFIKLRNKMGFVHDDAGHVIGRPDGNVFSCLWCTSVWVATVLLVLPNIVLAPFAVSTVAIVINEKLT